MLTSEEKYEWNTLDLVPDGEGAKLEDYEVVLQPAFGNKTHCVHMLFS